MIFLHLLCCSRNTLFRLPGSSLLGSLGAFLRFVETYRIVSERVESADNRINMTGRAAAVMPLQLSRDLRFFWEMRMESIMAVPARMPPRIRTYFANARYRTVTASARVQDLSGLKVVAEVPVVIPFS